MAAHATGAKSPDQDCSARAESPSGDGSEKRTEETSNTGHRKDATEREWTDLQLSQDERGEGGQGETVRQEPHVDGQGERRDRAMRVRPSQTVKDVVTDVPSQVRGAALGSSTRMKASMIALAA